MDPAALLALISDLYGQVQQLARENARLRAQVVESGASHEQEVKE